MPRIRNPKLLLIKKQKALIDSRLLQISLIMDNHIYKNIPISADNAALYIKEVSSYDNKCLNDKRSLQVIEKLIRCMKGIIQEHKELQDQNGNVYFARVEIPPPDLMDDDLTQLSQEIEVIEIKLQGKKKNVEKTVQFSDKTQKNKRVKFFDKKCYQNNILSLARVDMPPPACDDMTQLSTEVKDNTLQGVEKNVKKTVQFHDKSQTTKRAKFNDTDIIDLCDSNDEIRKTNNINKNNGDLETLHRAISELSIREENYTYDCKKKSHSILPDINSETTGKKNNKNLVINNQDLEQYIETINISKEFNKAEANNSKTAVHNLSKRKLLSITSLANEAAEIRKTEFTLDNNYDITIPVTQKSRRKPRKLTRRAKKGNIENLQQKTKRPRRKNTNKNIDEQVQSFVEKPIKQIEKNKKSKEIKKVPDTLKQIDGHPTKNIVTSETVQEKNNGFQNKCLSKHLHLNSDINLYNKMNTFTDSPIIYNKVVENDLSWIENIRYVREINVEEIIPAYYDDSFWDNYILPNDWNDSDFL